MSEKESTAKSTRVSDVVGPVIVFGLVIGAWYALSLAILPEAKRFLLPTPHRVVREGFLVWSAGEQRGLKPILLSLWDSVKIAIIGLSLTIVIGIALWQRVPAMIGSALDKKIAGIKERLKLSPDQESYWPGVEKALRAIARKPKGHDFVIDRRHTGPAVPRHMSVTGG